MKLPPSSRILSLVIAMLVMGGGGCALWNGSDNDLIRVHTARDHVKAQRLTIAAVKQLNKQNIEGASKKFMAAIAADETYGPAHNNLGLMHYEQGNLYQAVLAFEQAMEYMPSDPIVIYNLALTLEAAGKVSEAMDLYQQAVDMDPVNPVFLGNLVRLQLRMGETGPIVKTRLQDLILIETRPDWRRWADQKLALDLNDTLDRGPATPDFNPGGDKESRKAEFRIEDRVIELTPDRPGTNSQAPIPPTREPQPGEFQSREFQSGELQSGELQLSEPEFDLGPNASDLRSTQRIRDSRPIEIMPPGYPASDSLDLSTQPDFLQP